MINLQLSEIELETICQALSQAGLENNKLYKRLVSNITNDPVHARVKITHCKNKLRLVKAIVETTHMPLISAKNIVDNTVNGGILLLNESSIPKKQWESIAQDQALNIEWKYV